MKKNYQRLVLTVLFGAFLFVAQKLNAQTATIQFLHNSPDTAIKSVDIWINGSKMISALSYGSFTAPVSVASGNDTMVIRKTGDSVNILVTYYDSIPSGLNQLNLLFGLANPSNYAANPDNVSRSLSIATYNNFSNAGNTDMKLLFFNGSTDAPTFDLIRINNTGVKLADNQQFGNTSFTLNSITSNKNLLLLSSADSSTFYNLYRLDTLGMNGKVAMIYNSGFFGSTGNPLNSPSMKMNILTSGNSSTITIKPILSKLQFIHNSADSTLDSVDVYVNGQKTLPGFGFRSSTKFNPLVPLITNTLAVAPKHSTSVSQAFYTTTLIADTGIKYTGVFDGFRNTTGNSNPDGINIAFKLFTFKGAQDSAKVNVNVDLLYFHGSTDCRATSLQLTAASPVSKNDKYGSFHANYSQNPSQDNLTFDLHDYVTDSTIIKYYQDALAILPVGNLAKHKGEAGVIYTSGYYAYQRATDLHLSLTKVQQARVLGMYIAWSNGSTDTIQYPKINTGIYTPENHAAFPVTCYPNPAANIMNVLIELNTPSIVKIDLFDISGRLVISHPSNEKLSGESRIRVDLNELHNGMYFCVISVNGQTVTQKININR